MFGSHGKDLVGGRYRGGSYEKLAEGSLISNKYNVR